MISYPYAWTVNFMLWQIRCTAQNRTRLDLTQKWWICDNIMKEIVTFLEGVLLGWLTGCAAWDIDPILQKQWNSLGFINILKSWTHIKVRKAWNSLCFIDILKLGFPSSFENHWNSLRFIDISCGLLVFLLKNVEKPVLFWCFLVVASIWAYYYSSKWIWPRHKTSLSSTLYWGIAS